MRCTVTLGRFADIWGFTYISGFRTMCRGVIRCLCARVWRVTLRGNLVVWDGLAWVRDMMARDEGGYVAIIQGSTHISCV